MTSNAIEKAQPSALEAILSFLSNTERLESASVEVVERLFVLQKEQQAELSRREFNEAFNRAQMELQWPVKRRGENRENRSRYALAEDLTDMLDPIIFKRGSAGALSMADSQLEGMLRYVLTLRHSRGPRRGTWLDAPIDGKGRRAVTS